MKQQSLNREAWHLSRQRRFFSKFTHDEITCEDCLFFQRKVAPLLRKIDTWSDDKLLKKLIHERAKYIEHLRWVAPREDTAK